MQINKQKGFTLIEIIIVIAIIGILAAIAFPSYQESVRKSRRVEAKSVILEAAARQEKFFSQQYAYATTMNSTATVPGLGYNANPFITESGFYSIAITTTGTPASTYTLTASAIGAQAADDCKTLSLTNTGVKGATGGTVAECW
ncbi:type IV pilin protein [Alkalimarinus coralli]|uniref:type IV pilin protein n=1 Tax=Alkalimarinus coralli TaxID=2935863 RepID=UPI0023DF4590|nr:type IV pilin protein [Alkalimarinus coralli]